MPISRKGVLVTVFLLLISANLFSLEFSILNKGDIIFQEIFIETDDVNNSYYHNFGVQGLEPGARHNIHIYSSEDFLICSFYLYGISHESYAIEDVVIEQNSIVYILPEHYIEYPDDYSDLTVPNAVYGAQPFSRNEHPFDAPEVLTEDSFIPRNNIDVEIFNYTNSPVFRVYLESGDDLSDENYLTGGVLLPSESRTLSLPLESGDLYRIHLLGPDDVKFTKEVTVPLKADFLVFYDTDNLKALETRIVSVENAGEVELVELYLIDQESGNRQELLEDEPLLPGESREVMIQGDFSVCDLVGMTKTLRKIYLFDQDIPKGAPLVISDF